MRTLLPERAQMRGVIGAEYARWVHPLDAADRTWPAHVVTLLTHEDMRPGSGWHFHKPPGVESVPSSHFNLKDVPVFKRPLNSTVVKSTIHEDYVHMSPQPKFSIIFTIVFLSFNCRLLNTIKLNQYFPPKQISCIDKKMKGSEWLPQQIAEKHWSNLSPHSKRWQTARTRVDKSSYVSKCWIYLTRQY